MGAWSTSGKVAEDLRPGSLRSMHITTNSTKPRLLGGYAHYGRYPFVGDGGSQGCQGLCGRHPRTSSCVPVDKVLEWDVEEILLCLLEPQRIRKNILFNVL